MNSSILELYKEAKIEAVKELEAEFLENKDYQALILLKKVQVKNE